MVKKKEQGFTLVELMAAVVAASILLGAVVRLILLTQRTWLAAGKGAQQYSKTIASFEDLGSAVRSAGGVLKSDSDDTQLVLLTQSGSPIRYWFADGKLWRETGGEEKIVLQELQEGKFGYWQEKTGERSTPPSGGGYSVLVHAAWSGGSLKTGFFVREWS